MTRSSPARYFLKTNRVFIWGDIDERRARFIVQSIRYLVDKGSENIYLYIHSAGGEADAETAVIDEILGTQALGVTVYTIAQGKAYSAAADILTLGTKGARFATLNTAIMLHPLAYGLDMDNAKQNKRLTEFLTAQGDSLTKLVARACGHSSVGKFKKFTADIENGLWLTAKKAKTYGVIDGIWDYKMEREIMEDVKQSKDGE